MFYQIQNSILTKILWGLMGLFMLNISVDIADSKPEYIPEDLSINDQESIVEIFVEKVLGYEDAFKEYDDNDTEDHTKKTNLKIDLTTNHIKEEPLNHQITVKTSKRFPEYNAFLINGFQKLDIPPPKV